MTPPAIALLAGQGRSTRPEIYSSSPPSSKSTSAASTSSLLLDFAIISRARRQRRAGRAQSNPRKRVADDFQPPRELEGIGVHDPVIGMSLSADGLTLHYFAAHPERPEQGFDLWSVTRVPRQ